MIMLARWGYALMLTASLTVIAGCVQETQLPASISVENVGLSTPESILFDASIETYLVSNVSGDPLEKDNNGFISKIAPDGRVTELKWIDGNTEGVTLHAPKGMALVGDTLYVSDIDVVRLFDVDSGKPLGEVAVPGADFLNDLAAAPDGSVYVTDSGFGEGFVSTGEDAVYRITESGEVETVLASPDLSNPNGIVVLPNGSLLIAPFGAPALYTLTPQGNLSAEDFPAGSLDGIVRLADGTRLLSSWETSSVFRGAQGNYEVIRADVPSPADIAVDTDKNRLLIPIFTEDRLLFEALP